MIASRIGSGSTLTQLYLEIGVNIYVVQRFMNVFFVLKVPSELLLFQRHTDTGRLGKDLLGTSLLLENDFSLSKQVELKELDILF